MSAELEKELRQLRRGHGIHADNLPERVGPELRRVARIEPDDPLSAVRQKLLGWLTDGIGELAPDLRLAVQAALALAPASEDRFLRDRMVWLGEQIDRDPRTAIRRVSSGLTQLAQLSHRGANPTGSDPSRFAPRGWYDESLNATLLDNAEPVRLIETRRVVATVEGLARIKVSWSVPRHPDLPVDAQVAVDLIYGGDLLRDDEDSSPVYWTGWIILPRVLSVGDTHDYQVGVTSVSRTFMRPYYVVSPMRRMDRFELRAKFESGQVPERIWLLDGVPFRRVDESRPTRHELRADSVGEVQASFTNLQPGLSYGVQWSPRAAPARG